MHKKRYTGLEALSRGESEGRTLNAGQLFSLPRNEQENLYLNRQCIASAFESFSALPGVEDISIFINFDSELIDCPHLALGEILDMAEASGIEATRIVIELIESRVKNFSRFMDFVTYYRSKGILIALDDVGSGYSNFDRIVRIQPDIIKLDRGLVHNVAADLHQQAVCISLIELSHNIGAVALAEGVESLDDALVCQEMGVDMIQGFYFSEPVPAPVCNSSSIEAITKLTAAWQRFFQQHVQLKARHLGAVKKAAEAIACLLHSRPEEEWSDILRMQMGRYDNIQCLYILDFSGMQISETVVASDEYHNVHQLFQPARKGEDHSFKSYYAKRRPFQDWFVSDPYISNVTGALCRTINLFFQKNEKSYYLCLDTACPSKTENL